MEKLRQRKVLLITLCVLGFLGIIVSFFLLLNMMFGSSKSSSEDSSTSSSETQDSGVAVGSNITGLISNVNSTRNLSGLTLRINQIDVCKLPDLTAYVSVTTDNGDISQFTSNDVTVELDGKKLDNAKLAKIDTRQQPLSAALVIDRSGSMEGDALARAKDAAKLFVSKAGSNDKLAVIQFDNEVQVLNALTTDRTVVNASLDSIAVRGDTALYDAAHKGVVELSGCSRKAAIILSDGKDTASSTDSLESAVNAANQAAIPFFVVGLRGTAYDAASLTTMANSTGGFFLDTSNPSELAGLYDKVDRQLKSQFFVGMKLDIPKTNKEHRLKVTSNIKNSPTVSERSFNY